MKDAIIEPISTMETSGNLKRDPSPTLRMSGIYLPSIRMTRTLLVKYLLQIFVAVSFISVLAQVYIHLPFTPVPVTGQTLAVLLIGSLMETRRAMSAILVYIAAGILGAPIFSMGTAGSAVLLGSTGGYLVGFILATYVVSKLFQTQPKTLVGTLARMWIGSLCIFSCGLLWLGQFVGYKNVVALGFMPFVLGDFLKISIAATTYTLIKKRV